MGEPEERLCECNNSVPTGFSWNVEASCIGYLRVPDD